VPHPINESNYLTPPFIPVFSEIMKLEAPLHKYVVHCGEMGSHWGISRSVAQIHALLFVVGHPMTADEMVETLDIARSNVSAGLKELQSWGLVKVTQKMGDRRDYFESFSDVWESFRAIIKARKHREIEPSIQAIRECVEEANAKSSMVEAAAIARLEAMLNFVELMDAWGERAAKLSPKNLRRLSHLADAIFRLVE
jgi:DNA-binding transcriptional regulator GbsR (MarR family)